MVEADGGPNILITGGNGYLGSSLALRFAADYGCKVFLPLRPSADISRLIMAGGSCKLFSFHSHDELTGYIRMVKPDVVIHTSCNYGRHNDPLAAIVEANVAFGVTILDALNAVGHPVTFINTGTALSPEVSSYARSKHQFEAWGRSVASPKFQFLNIRLQHFFGPGDDRSKFVSHVIHACIEDSNELPLTAGAQQRDFIFIDDVVDAYAMLVSKRGEFACVDDIDLGSGEVLSIRDLVERIHQLTGSSIALRFGALPYREHESMFCVADISRLRRLGWVPGNSLDDGLRKTIEFETDL